MKDSDNLIGSISGWFSYFFLSMRLEHSMEVNISFLDYIQRNGTRSTFDTPLWIGNWTKHHLEVGCRLPTQTIVLHPDLRPLFNDCPIIELQLLRLEVCVRYNAGMIALAPCSPMPGYSYHFKDGQTKWHGGGTAHFTVRLMQIYMSTTCQGFFAESPFRYRICGLYLETKCQKLKVQASRGVLKHQPTQTRECTVLFSTSLFMVGESFAHTFLVFAVALHLGCFLFLPSESFSLWTTTLLQGSNECFIRFLEHWLDGHTRFYLIWFTTPYLYDGSSVINVLEWSSPSAGRTSQISFGVCISGLYWNPLLWRWTLSRGLFSGESVSLWRIMSPWIFEPSKLYGCFMRALIHACASIQF